MNILSGDPLTQLAFSIYQNKGVFALLLGSGLSRGAGIPIGWEITLDLIRRVAVAKGVKEDEVALAQGVKNPAEVNWERWYCEETCREPNYSTLLKELALTQDERRSILDRYIEPSEEERENGHKVPTEAHKAIANLVQAGYIKVIITTNFDRLLEKALADRGIEPTVVASEDALKGAEPISHSTCYILKLHGDYKDNRIRNTEEELSEYPREYNELLDRILDEYGLIVCGWSGEWDHALRGAILRAPNRRYSMYWAARDKPSDVADDLVKHRKGQFISISIANADEFFSDIWAHVQNLAQIRPQNPLSVDLLISTTKRYLSKDEYRIQLDELFADETRRLIHDLSDPSLFNQQADWSGEEFRRRVPAYEMRAEPFVRTVGVLGRWGDSNELTLVLDAIRSICAQADEIPGTTQWLYIRSYPAVLIFTAYGLGLVRARRWKTLHQLFSEEIYSKPHATKRVVERLFLKSWEGGQDNYWQELEGLRKYTTPLSKHLWEVFEPWSKSFVGAIPDFEVLFGLFETLASLAYSENQPGGTVPVGRSGCSYEMPFSRLRDQLLPEVASNVPDLLKAGFFNGDEDSFYESMKSLVSIAKKRSTFTT